MEHRAKEQVQSSEPDVLFGFRAGGPQEPNPVPFVDGVVEQRRLADARLTRDDEGATSADSRTGEQLIHCLLLGNSSDEHLRSLGHGAGQSLPQALRGVT